MIVIEKNAGPKIPYEVTGTKITFDDDLMLNLGKRQGDEPVHIDICSNSAHQLITGTQDARAFVTQIDIPPREYTEPETEEEAPEPLPLDMEKVVLTLWAVA